jgi:AraC-like DNA-binding protein
MRSSGKYDSNFYKRIISAKDYINDNLDSDITLNDISQIACLSQYHFLRQFKKIYNKTPHEYLTERRIEKAKNLLQDENYSVTDVCFEVGFQRPGSFSSLFTRIVGFSPALYRHKMNRKLFIVKFFPEKLIPGCFSPDCVLFIKKLYQHSELQQFSRS